MEIFNLIFRYIFLGFILWTFVWAFRADKYTPQSGTNKFDLFITRTVIGLGILYIPVLIFNFIEFNAEDIKMNESLSERAFGKYWFGYWMHLVTFFGLPQLLWIPKIRLSKIIRIIIALWIFVVMHIEIFIILITSLHRDYLPADWR